MLLFLYHLSGLIPGNPIQSKSSTLFDDQLVYALDSVVFVDVYQFLCCLFSIYGCSLMNELDMLYRSQILGLGF